MKRFATMFVFSFMALVCIAPSASAQSFSLGGPTDAGDYIQFDANADVSGDFSVTTSPAVNLYSDNAGTLVALAGNQPGLYPVDYSPLFLYLRKSEITSTITVTAVAPDGSVYSGSYTPPASSLTPTTTLLAITPASPAWGTQVTLTATVTSGSGTPTGDVKFFEGATQLGAAAPLNAGGVATFSSETFSLGSHTPITAVYVGNTSFETSTSPAGSFTVNPAVLIISGITAAPKVYDATVAASLDVAGVYLTGVVPGDDIHVNAAAATGTFPDKNVGTNRTVTIAGVSVTGTSLGNYTFSQPSTTATISAKPLTVTGVGASDKVYDGNAIAALTFASPTLVGAISGDDVTLNSAGVSGAFADKNVGPSKPVTITGLTLAGTDAGNYTLTQPSANASITPAPAVVTATAATKVYGTPDPALTGNLSGFVPADGITATFARTAGETVAGTYTISSTLNPAPALTNYAITYNSAAFTITKAPASVTPATASKVYGTPDPVFTGTLTGFLSADNVTATYSRTTGETVGSYVISATLSPSSVLGNYQITYNTAPFTISPSTATLELIVRFDPENQDISVVEAGSLTVVDPQPTADGHDKHAKNRDRRTYRYTDTDGNWVEIVVSVKQDGHELMAEVLSVAYSNSPNITKPDNSFKVEWATNKKTDDLKELQQKIELKPLIQVEANYDGKKDVTKIDINQKSRHGDKKQTYPGLVLIGMRTENGTLVYDGPGLETTVTAGVAPDIHENLDRGDAVLAEATKTMDEAPLPTELALLQNYPNPFNPATTIAFDLPEPVYARLAVYDMLGREVVVLVNGSKTAGHHSVIFNASDLPSGMYIYRLQAGSFVQTKKLMLMK